MGNAFGLRPRTFFISLYIYELYFSDWYFAYQSFEYVNVPLKKILLKKRILLHHNQKDASMKFNKRNLSCRIMNKRWLEQD